MDTYLPTYLPTCWPFFTTPDVSIGYQRKEICAIGKEKGRSFFYFSFFFSLFSTLPLLLVNGFRFFPWVKRKQSKRKEKKRKEKKNNFVQNQSLFSHPFSVFFFLFFSLLYSFTLKSP
jgi:hypothetical protein